MSFFNVSRGTSEIPLASIVLQIEETAAAVTDIISNNGGCLATKQCSQFILDTHLMTQTSTD